MRRRHFIALLGGAAASWQFTARAQQSDRTRRIGVLMGGLDPDDAGGHAEMAALKRGLQERGWIEFRNLEFKYGWPGGAPDAIRSSARELVDSKCDVIVARSTLTVSALLKETRTIPIVFTVVVDPVGSGFVKSFARPEGNVTGFQNFEFTMVGKWAQILKEMSPEVQRVAFLYNPTTVPTGWLPSLEATGPPISVPLVRVPVHDPTEIDVAVDALAREPGIGLADLPDVFMVQNRDRLIAAAAKHRLPAIYTGDLWTKSGGLMSYGPVTIDLFYRAASYVDRILKGESPANLTVQAPTKYQLVINLKTAKALGFNVPATLLGRADEVIE
jgi:putative tryptophan/tyrosine transport system substrate-binding protein